MPGRPPPVGARDRACDAVATPWAGPLGACGGEIVSAHRFRDHLKSIDAVRRTGRVRRILPTSIEADGPALPIGALCRVHSDGGPGDIAQVAAIDEQRIILIPFERSFAP